jgi:dihydrolipoamide dehydrogenase
MAKEFDLIVIGGGPGGYVGAIRAAQLGLSVAVAEREKMGGICLNWGCIPTKAMLESAHKIQEIKEAGSFGIRVEKLQFSLPEIVSYSRKVSDQMASGVDFLMKKNNIEILKGEARLKSKKQIALFDLEGKEIAEYSFQNLILALGARSKELPTLPFDSDKILSSREAMVQKEIPKRLGIIGAGAIGVEFADIYSSLGAKVTIIEALDRILPNEDKDLSVQLTKSFQKRGIETLTGTSLKDAKKGKQITLNLEDRDKKATILEVDKVIVGIGVVPNTSGIGLEEIGIKISRGFIDVNHRYQTSVSGIYAIGDCIASPLLAHVASQEGIRAAEDISIRSGNPHGLGYNPLDYKKIPACTYCHPEIASVGYTEEKAKAEGLDIAIGKIPFTANGRARAGGDSQGFIKLIAEKKSGRILGGHILGTSATELINEISLAMHSELLVDDLAKSVHAHPSISEVIMEAAEACLGHAIHI